MTPQKVTVTTRLKLLPPAEAPRGFLIPGGGFHVLMEIGRHDFPRLEAQDICVVGRKALPTEEALRSKLHPFWNALAEAKLSSVGLLASQFPGWKVDEVEFVIVSNPKPIGQNEYVVRPTDVFIR